MDQPRSALDRLLSPNPRAGFWARIAFALALFLAGCYFCAGSGPLPVMLRRASYDWACKLSFLRNPDISKSPVVIVYVDELSQTALEQPRNRPWDRAIYASMLDRLREEGARAVVLDVIFSGPSEPVADDALAKAIRDNGRVILGVDRAISSQTTAEDSRAQFETLVFPEEQFVQEAAGLGLVHLKADEDFIVREHFHDTPYDGLASLSWAAAALADAPAAQGTLARERWVRYYGGPETIPHISFHQALRGTNQPGFFKDKVVFIGARPTATLLVERRDEFRSAFESWNGRFLFMPAVEVHATMLLNLLRQDWLVRTPPAIEFLLAGLGAFLAFKAVNRLKPVTVCLSAFAITTLVVATVSLLYRFGIWTPWLVAILLFIPAWLVACFLSSSLGWIVQRRIFRAQEKEANRRIQEQAALLDKAHDAIIVLDLTGKPVFWNNGAARTYGWSLAEATQEKLADLVAAGSAEMHTARAATLAMGEWTGELKNRTRDGKTILVQSRWSLLRDDSGAPKGILLIATDVTEQRSLEAQLLRSQRLDSLGTLAGGIAHDLNNILSPIFMGVELVRMKVGGQGADHLLDTIDTSAKRGAALVKQVLTFARGVEGEQKIVQVRHLLKEMDKILAETFPKNVNVAIQVSPRLHTVKADITQLHQVLLNLCVNARDAMPDGGQLKIDADNAESVPPHLFLDGIKPEGEFILIKVADTGSGIPPEIAQKIFEPFFTTKELGKGTGLGLATVATIVRKHAGYLDFKSVVGKGTEFHLYLPAAKEGAVASSAAQGPATVTGCEELILVVDDEQPIRAMFEEMLTASNYKVVTASHASAALEIVADSGSSLGAVLMDRMMPGMDPLKAMQHMKLLHPELPIICMSGIAPADREALDATANAFLQKPFNREKLLETLQKQIAQKPALALH